MKQTEEKPRMIDVYREQEYQGSLTLSIRAYERGYRYFEHLGNIYEVTDSFYKGTPYMIQNEEIVKK